MKVFDRSHVLVVEHVARRHALGLMLLRLVDVALLTLFRVLMPVVQGILRACSVRTCQIGGSASSR